MATSAIMYLEMQLEIELIMELGLTPDIWNQKADNVYQWKSYYVLLCIM